MGEKWELGVGRGNGWELGIGGWEGIQTAEFAPTKKAPPTGRAFKNQKSKIIIQK